MELQELTERMHQFVGEKGWYESSTRRPQTPYNLAVALNVEAGELLELFMWGDSPTPESLADELADVALYLLQLSSVSGIDLERAILGKLERNFGRTWTDP